MGMKYIEWNGIRLYYNDIVYTPEDIILINGDDERRVAFLPIKQNLIQEYGGD